MPKSQPCLLSDEGGPTWGVTIYARDIYLIGEIICEQGVNLEALGANFDVKCIPRGVWPQTLEGEGRWKPNAKRCGIVAR